VANSKKRNEFRFVVAGVELSHDQEQRIANAVARAGVQALAEIDFGRPRPPAASFIPREWLGRWLEFLEPSVSQELEGALGIKQEING
jgi:hypothetical protein